MRTMAKMRHAMRNSLWVTQHETKRSAEPSQRDKDTRKGPDFDSCIIPYIISMWGIPSAIASQLDLETDCARKWFVVCCNSFAWWFRGPRVVPGGELVDLLISLSRLFFVSVLMVV